MLINVPVSLTPPGPTRPRMTSGDQQHESIQMPSRPQFPLLHSESKELVSRTSKVASGRCLPEDEDAAPKTKTPQGDRSSAACESVHPRPSPPRSSPLPLPRAAAGPPVPAPPPVCDGGRAAVRAERSEAERTLPPDPIQAQRSAEKRATGTCAQGPGALGPAEGFRTRVGR